MRNYKKKPRIEIEYDSDKTPGESESENEINEFINFTDASSKSVVCESSCWGCLQPFGKKTKVGKNKAMDQLNAAFFENKDLHEIKLASLISSLHEELFVKTQTNKDTIKIWTRDSVLTHLRSMLDPEVTFRRNIHDLNVIEQNVKNITHLNSSGQTTIDYQALTALVQISKQRTTLFAAIKTLGK